MNTGDDLKRGMKEVRDAAKRTIRAAAASSDGGSHINVARRTNIKVAKNVGHDGGTAHASATQVAPIEQHGEKDPG
jgi:predicted site-specific integrase-resolvase